MVASLTLVRGNGDEMDADARVDLAGAAVVPGFFDCHTHVTVSGFDYMALLQRPFSFQFYEAVENLRRTLDIGITTIRDAHGADLGVQQAVERGLIPGPRMQISVTAISQTGGHGDGWMASGNCVELMPAHPGRPAGIVDGPDEMRRKVRELIRASADVIKVFTSGEATAAGGRVPAAVIDKAHAVIDIHRRAVTRAIEAGIKIAMGPAAESARTGRICANSTL